MKSLTHLMPLAGLAAGLAGVAGLEMSNAGPAPVPVPAVALAPPAPSAGNEAAMEILAISRRAEILARPLFRAVRRPPATPEAHRQEVPLPRLSGILIGADQRLALFAAAGGKTQAAGEGGQIGAYRILQIGTASVTLARGQQRLVLRPRFEAKTPSAVPPTGAFALSGGAIQTPALRGFGMPERR